MNIVLVHQLFDSNECLQSGWDVSNSFASAVPAPSIMGVLYEKPVLAAFFVLYFELGSVCAADQLQDRS